MKKFLFLLTFLLLIASAWAAENNIPETKVYYFYSNSCSHCANVVDSGILERVAEMENVSVSKYEILTNQRNQELFLDYVKKFEIEGGGIPFLVIEQDGKFSYLQGDAPIINNLENLIVNFNGISFDDFSSKNLTLWLVIITALIDSINPCAFGVLLFLMAFLLSMGSTKRAFKYGMIYSFVIFIVYFLAGLGITKIINAVSLNYVSLAVGVILIIAALIEFKDFFWEGKGFSLKIPVSAKPILEKFVHKGTLPAIIILGALVALVELPCTGIIYLGILSLISESGVIGIFYLAIYNIIFILPLLILTWIVYRGASTDFINGWVQRNKKYMRLAAGIIMILLALSLFGII
ncbi:MAG: hypothetical protein WC548_01785 [Candidatus Pacearchaeota archaeon]